MTASATGSRRTRSKFNEALFQEALAKPRLQQPLPECLPGNRAGGKVRVRNEDELRAMTRQWFVDYEAKLAHYRKLGVNIDWTLDWAKKYWWSWIMLDMSMNDELYTPDLKYVDPTTFGRTIVGLKEFVDYNMAFFAAIPDWRYDPLPGQVYLDLTPKGEVRIIVRYIGSGHFSGNLRLYPYDDTAPVLYGNGAFVQCAAVDRYHFNSDGLMYEGETLWDFIDATQSAGIMPSAESPLFRSLMGASRLVRAWKQTKERIPFLKAP